VFFLGVLWFILKTKGKKKKRERGKGEGRAEGEGGKKTADAHCRRGGRRGGEGENREEVGKNMRVWCKGRVGEKISDGWRTPHAQAEGSTSRTRSGPRRLAQRPPPAPCNPAKRQRGRNPPQHGRRRGDQGQERGRNRHVGKSRKKRWITRAEDLQREQEVERRAWGGDQRAPRDAVGRKKRGGDRRLGHLGTPRATGLPKRPAQLAHVNAKRAQQSSQPQTRTREGVGGGGGGTGGRVVIEPPPPYGEGGRRKAGEVRG